MRVVLLLGSNVEAARQLEAAAAELRRLFPITAESAWHLSPASGRDDAPAYLNQAMVIEYTGDRAALRTSLRDIEARLGRQRPSPDPRLCPIDIDAIGRCSSPFETWDEKACNAAHARLPLHEIGIFCTPP